MSCIDCGGKTIWDDEATSNICTACGTLVDSSQSVLVSQVDTVNGGSQLIQTGYNFAPTGAKGANGWELAGQSKESKLRRNTYAIHGFIKSLSTSLHLPILRAETIFDQAMSTGRFRWGRKAQLVAGASVSIALRQAKRPDSIRQIAHLLGETDWVPLHRVVLAVSTALNLSFQVNKPLSYLTTLQAHLSEFLASGDTTILSSSTLALIRPLSMNAVLATGTSLLECLHEISPSTLTLTPGPTACAILMYALEAEARATLPKIPEIAQLFSQKINAGKGAVAKRYQGFQEDFRKSMAELPWLSKYEVVGGRSAVSKRLVIARGLKDLIQWKGEVWKNMAQLDLPKVDDESSDDGTEDMVYTEVSTVAPAPAPAPSHDSIPLPSKNQKKKIVRRDISDAARFLLDPLNAPLPRTESKTENDSPDSTSALTTYILTGPTDSVLGSKVLPTRLQLLSASRGGTDEKLIPDEELFEEGEFEGMCRNDEEQESFLRLFEQASPPKNPSKVNKRKAEKEIDSSERQSSGKHQKVKTSRVNLKAMAEFLGDGSGDTVLGRDCFSEEDKQDAFLEHNDKDEEEDEDHGYPLYSFHDDGGAVVLDWRPPSPVGHSADQYYEEEYD
ncbi:hypothetical protein C8J56DRAFT_865148 [Mycena floridula]|nr:hypothetical protein C8J56DRAFT_865148 [Mycena floridula]